MSDYRESVVDLAKSILDALEVKTQEDFEKAESNGSVYERAWEDVDSSAWIIYYSNNLEVLQQSNNSDAIDDAGMEIDTSKGWQSIITQVAFYAMLADINDEIRSLVEELPEDAEEVETEEEEAVE